MVPKNALRHHLEKLKDNYPRVFGDIDINSIELYLDISTEPEEILKVLGDNLERFHLIIRKMLLGRYDDEVYRRESQNIPAMKFSNPNSRIYCKEIPSKEFDGKKRIVMTRLVRNKDKQKNGKSIKEIINAIEEYDFTFYQKKEDIK